MCQAERKGTFHQSERETVTTHIEMRSSSRISVF